MSSILLKRRGANQSYKLTLPNTNLNYWKVNLCEVPWDILKGVVEFSEPAQGESKYIRQL